MVGGGVADAIAAGLNRVHVDACQIGQDIRDLLELGPVVLNVLSRSEVPVVTIVVAGDVRQHAQLPGIEHSVGNSHPQHRCVFLDIKTIAQAQRAEFLLAQLAGQKAARLVTELRHPFGHERAVNVIVLVHSHLL